MLGRRNGDAPVTAAFGESSAVKATVLEVVHDDRHPTSALLGDDVLLHDRNVAVKLGNNTIGRVTVDIGTATPTSTCGGTSFPRQPSGGRSSAAGGVGDRWRAWRGWAAQGGAGRGETADAGQQSNRWRHCRTSSCGSPAGSTRRTTRPACTRSCLASRCASRGHGTATQDRLRRRWTRCWMWWRRRSTPRPPRTSFSRRRRVSASSSRSRADLRRPSFGRRVQARNRLQMEKEVGLGRISRAHRLRTRRLRASRPPPVALALPPQPFPPPPRPRGGGGHPPCSPPAPAPHSLQKVRRTARALSTTRVSASAVCSLNPRALHLLHAAGCTLLLHAGRPSPKAIHVFPCQTSHCRSAVRSGLLSWSPGSQPQHLPLFLPTALRSPALAMREHV